MGGAVPVRYLLRDVDHDQCDVRRNARRPDAGHLVLVPVRLWHRIGDGLSRSGRSRNWEFRSMTAWNPSVSTRRMLMGTLFLCSLLIVAEAAIFDVNSSSCPHDAIAVEPGASIQAAVDFADDGAVFCLKSGIHRAQAVRPRPKQRFYGEGQTVLNGSRLLTGFRREEGYWAVGSQLQRGPKHGECLPSVPTCNQPEALFIDDRPLTKVSSKGE